MSSLGATIRRMFGPYERQIAELYRSIFINLDSLAEFIRTQTQPTRILEIGCGEGALAERIARDFPDTPYLGIDIVPQTGRLYDGPLGTTDFRVITAQELAEESPGKYGLVIINDVMHHVVDPLREEILQAAKTLLEPDGLLLMKDWIRRSTPIHAAVYVADVYIGGDRNVRYMPLQEQRDMINEVFGADAIVCEQSIRPWRQNHAFLVRKYA